MILRLLFGHSSRRVASVVKSQTVEKPSRIALQAAQAKKTTVLTSLGGQAKNYFWVANY